MRIDVTREDIEQGRANNCRLCPVAKAVGRVLEVPVLVQNRFVQVFFKGKILTHDYTTLLPREAREFVRLFDGAGAWAAEEENRELEEPELSAAWRTQFEPFTFDLEVCP